MHEPNGQGAQPFAGYSECGQLELHDGEMVPCREPTFAEGGTLFELWRRTMVGPEHAAAYRELRELFPVAVGLQAEFAVTPMNSTEFMEIVGRFFRRPSRRPMAVDATELASTAEGTAPQSSMM